MFSGWTIAVVVPAHNEERLIAQTLDGVPDYVDYVVVIDDASEDGTWGAMATARARAGLIFLSHSVNCGVGGAIVTGYKHALSLGAEAVAVMAGDAQMDPADLPNLLRPVVAGRADYAKGNRLSFANAVKIMPLVRYLGNHVLSLLTRLTSGYPGIRDSQCGYTVISAAMLRALDLDDLFPRYGFPNDILAALHAQGARVAQVIVRPIYGEERSELSVFRSLFRIPLVLLSSMLKRLAMEHRSMVRNQCSPALLSEEATRLPPV